MPIYNEKSDALMKEFIKANEDEATATKCLLDLMNSGCNDNEIINSANKKFTDSHSHKMDIYSKLQEFRLDR